MDPMAGQPGYAPAGHQQGGDSGGACSNCGRPLPSPDLEAVAASIDQTLSMESGRMVERTAWAGRAPDGMMDSLLSFIPSVKARRQLWERGQALWTERMTQVMSGPCDSCRGVAPAPQPAYGSPDPYAPGPATPAYGQPDQPPAPDPTGGTPYAGATSVMPDYGSSSGQPPEQSEDSMTSIVPPLTPHLPTAQGPAPTPGPPMEDDQDPATTAMPAFTGRPAEPPASASGPPPAPAAPPSQAAPSQPAYVPEPADEHESHTVMISAPINLRGGPRLIVIDGPVHGRQFTLGRQLTTIGRSIGCHITVESDAIGYDHARVVRGDDGWRVESIAGAGDTYVNDDVVTDRRTLQSGDVIRVGPARLRFELVG